MDNICIKTERLILLTPTIDILQRGLSEDDFYEKVLIDKKEILINFSREWTAASRVIFPIEIEQRKNDPDILPFWFYLIIDRETWTVIGGIVCKTVPDLNNEVEIGYGINPGVQKKGYGTETVQHFTDYLLSRSDIAAVKAECNIFNISSIKVLEKCNFERVGIRFDEEDGDLIIWKKLKI